MGHRAPGGLVALMVMSVDTVMGRVGRKLRQRATSETEWVSDRMGQAPELVPAATPGAE